MFETSTQHGNGKKNHLKMYLLWKMAPLKMYLHYENSLRGQWPPRKPFGPSIFSLKRSSSQDRTPISFISWNLRANVKRLKHLRDDFPLKKRKNTNKQRAGRIFVVWGSLHKSHENNPTVCLGSHEIFPNNDWQLHYGRANLSIFSVLVHQVSSTKNVMKNLMIPAVDRTVPFF